MGQSNEAVHLYFKQQKIMKRGERRITMSALSVGVTHDDADM